MERNRYGIMPSKLLKERCFQTTNSVPCQAVKCGSRLKLCNIRGCWNISSNCTVSQEVTRGHGLYQMMSYVKTGILQEIEFSIGEK